MKKILILILVFVASGTSLFAQQKQQKNKTAEERTEKIYTKLNEALELRDDQKLKVKDIILVREQARDNDKKELGANSEALKKANQVRNEEREENLKANLSPAQYAKLLEFRDKKKKERHMNKEAKTAEESNDEL